MKRSLFLFSLLAMAFNGFSQKSLFPRVEQIPETGFEVLGNKYPYMLYQLADSAHPGNWNNSSLATFEPSQVPGYFAKRTTSAWENSDWVKQYWYVDTFILDNQQRIDYAIEDLNYNYPGFTNRTKLKYKYTYDAQGKITNLLNQRANPATSSNYIYYANYAYMYNANGQRIKDSSTYYQAPYPWFSYYEYNANGKVSAIYGVDGDPSLGGETTYVETFTYDGELLITNNSKSFDQSSNMWVPGQSDTFQYDVTGRVIRRISWAMTSINGGPFEFQPTRNETYTYNSDNLLLEVLYHTWDAPQEQWFPISKTNLQYTAANEPFQGLTYAYVNGNLQTTPYQRIWFINLNGLGELKKELQMSVYPNPAKEKVYVNVGKESGEAVITVLDLSGKMMSSETVSFYQGTAELQTDQLNKGIYFIEVNNGVSRITRKFVVE